MDDAASPAVGVAGMRQPVLHPTLFDDVSVSTARADRSVLARRKPASPHEGMTPHGVAALSLMVRNGQE